MKNLLLAVFVGALYVITGENVWAQTRVENSVFLLGNSTLQNEQSVRYLQQLTEGLSQPYTFVFLGNCSEIKQQGDRQKLIVPGVALAPGMPVLYVNGEKEWMPGKKHTREVAEAMQKAFAGHPVYTTEWGCPGPVEVSLSEHLVVILLDTEWWLTNKDTRYGKCSIENDRDVFIWLQDALRRNRNKVVLIAGFHPIESAGIHGGHFPAVTSVLGFPYVAYRKFMGCPHDLSFPEYKNLRRQFTALLNHFPNVIYAASLEHSLQYLQVGRVHQVISGSIEQQEYVNASKAEFASTEAGLARIDRLENGDVVLNFFTINNGAHEPVYRKVLFRHVPIKEEQLQAYRNQLFLQPYRLVPASTRYQASADKKKWLGANYRKVWATPIKARVFDITKEKGGLQIVKRGGGQQTRSLRLEANDGHQYVLRSIDKFAEGALPEPMRQTFAKDLVQDQISASNPYGALPAAVLAEYAGVFHTNPEVVYVPLDPMFGQYVDDMRSGLFLFEERPAKDCSDIKSFGYSKKVVGTDDVLENTIESEDFKVDQKAVLRARLLDIYINDWDRHDDQWRWASFKEDGRTVYRPIPRDRDQAFFVNQGWIPRFASLPFILPKIQNFQPKTKNVIGLGYNARYFDRTFLTEMGRDDWEKMSDELMQRMTPRALSDAMSAFPKEVQPLVADSTYRILWERKKYMTEMADEYYRYLARRVDIPGTNRKDIFVINRKNDEQTEVSVFHRKKDGSRGKTIFHRTFFTDETREIVCYGLDDEDRFLVQGEVKKGPVIRLVGGADRDEIVDSSGVKGLSKKTKVYDLKKSTLIESDGEVSRRLSNNKLVNEYNRKYFKRDVGVPVILAGYNEDDGIFAGFGRLWYFQRFRRDVRVKLFADYVFRNESFNVRGSFESLSTNTGLDFLGAFEVSDPRYSVNFYGFGNETDGSYPGREYHYFRVLQRRMLVETGMQKRFGPSVWARYDDDEAKKEHPVNEHRVGVKTIWKQNNVEEEWDRFIGNFEMNGLSPDDLQKKQHLILQAYYGYRNLNRETLPTRGWTFEAQASRYFNIWGNESDFTKFSSSATALLSFSKYPRTVLAFRGGAEKNFGDYYFPEAAILGGKTNLRGYRQTRFYGDAAAFLNSEARVKLFDLHNYWVSGDLGVLFFYDTGRVWLDGEDSDTWHKGYGGGFWISPFRMAVLTTTLNLSKEDTLLQVRLSYLF